MRHSASCTHTPVSCIHIHRIHVSPYLQPLTAGPKQEPIRNVFAIGDNALPLRGDRLPATAQVASQMANWVSKTLKQTAKGSKLEDTSAFVWKNRGSMVFVGDYRVCPLSWTLE